MASSLWQTEVFIHHTPPTKGILSRSLWQRLALKEFRSALKTIRCMTGGIARTGIAHLWRCPLKVKNADSTCHCSTSDYGRVVYTHSTENLRLFPKTPRSSPTWKSIYDHRTAAERVFKRQKLDFKLTQFKTRSKGRHLFYAPFLRSMSRPGQGWIQKPHRDKNGRKGDKIEDNTPQGALCPNHEQKHSITIPAQSKSSQTASNLLFISYFLRELCRIDNSVNAPIADGVFETFEIGENHPLCRWVEPFFRSSKFWKN